VVDWMKEQKWRWVIVGLAGLFALQAYDKFRDSVRWGHDPRPPAQVQFESTLAYYLDQYNGSWRGATKAEVCRRAWQWTRVYSWTAGMEIKNWRGRVDPAGIVDDSGKIELVIVSKFSGMRIWYYGHLPRDIAKSSAVADLRTWDKVVFSGRFNWGLWAQGLAFQAPLGAKLSESNILEESALLIELDTVNKIEN